MKVCLCGNINLNGETVSKNWNPDCPVHPWSERLQAQADKAVEMQAQAAVARRAFFDIATARRQRFDRLRQTLLEAAADCDERGLPHNVGARFRNAAEVCELASQPQRR